MSIINGLEEKGVIIESNVPLNILMYRANSKSTMTGGMGGAMIPPLHENDKKFLVTAFDRRRIQASFSGPYFIVTASEDSTRVMIKKGSEIKYVNLNKFQTYSYDSDDGVTGYTIEADKPVGVIAGDGSTMNYVRGLTGRSGSQFASMPASHRLGKKYIMPPIGVPETSVTARKKRPEEGGYIVKVVAEEDGTEVVFNQRQTNLIDQAEFAVFQQDLYNQATLVECSKPCLAVLLSKYKGTNTAALMTHLMFAAVPVEKYYRKTHFMTVDVRVVGQQYLSIIVSGSLPVTGVKVDEKEVTDGWEGFEGYSYNVVSIDSGPHVISAGRKFAAYVHGHFAVGTVSAGGYGYSIMQPSKLKVEYLLHVK